MGGQKMSIYEKFASLYAQGEYDRFSARMADLLPDVLGKFSMHPETILDLACGEGTFAVKMAGLGYKVTGLDRSPQMLHFARKKAKEEGVDVPFVTGDMRKLSFNHSFDLVTCWFDSLNYLLDLEELKETFQGVSNVLPEKGLFIFDMNTIYGLEVEWQNPPCYVQQDNSKVFEVHRTSFNSESNIASLKIIGFIMESDQWTKIEEEHRERGYPLHDIRNCLQAAGLEELACWDNLQMKTEPDDKSGRVWFIAQKSK